MTAPTARALRAALATPPVDLVTVATQARALFAPTDPLRARWMELELGGYRAIAQTPMLHDLLGVPLDHHLARTVADYRTQIGRIWTKDARRDTVFHFFVEPLAEIVAARDRVRAADVQGFVKLAFAIPASVPEYPRTLEFSADVFEVIVSGIKAALWHEIGDVAP